MKGEKSDFSLFFVIKFSVYADCSFNVQRLFCSDMPRHIS